MEGKVNSMNDRVRLTTTDNPFDPFKDWDEWYFYDLTKGYCTCEQLARIAPTSYKVSDEINYDEVEAAIERLLFIGAIGKDGTMVNYKKVYNPDLKPTVDDKAVKTQ